MSSESSGSTENRFREVARFVASRSIFFFRKTVSSCGPLSIVARAGVLLLSGAIFGCAAPTQHTPEPYRSDAALGAILSERATLVCEQAAPNQGVMPVRPFVTDGCSRFPDTEWNLDCCIEHDIAYWCGGDAKMRLLADEEFGRCVASKSNGFLGWVMKAGVRMGGHPFFPSSYRWGYGHPYRASYPSASVPR